MHPGLSRSALRRAAGAGSFERELVRVLPPEDGVEAARALGAPDRLFRWAEVPPPGG
jgi:hypothetical protein